MVDTRLYNYGFSERIDRTYLAFDGSYSKYVLGCLRIKKSDIIEWLGLDNQLPKILDNSYLLKDDDIIHKMIIESVIFIFNDGLTSQGTEDFQRTIIENFFRDFNCLFTRSKIKYILNHIRNNPDIEYEFDLQMVDDVFITIFDDLY